MPRTSVKERDQRSVIAVERACDLLVAICSSREGPMGVKDLSETLKLSASSVHRILAALVKRGLVEQDPDTRKYAMGRVLLDMSLDRLHHLDLPVAALPHMRRLRDATRETVALSVVDGWTQTFVAQVESPQEIRQKIEIGRRLPLHSGGSGKATLAFLPEAEREAYLAQPKLAPAANGPVNLKRLRLELSQIRRCGYSRSVGERVAGAAAVAAPIFNHLGQVAGCLSVSGPFWRFNEQKFPEYGQHAMQSAIEVSKDLGAPVALVERKPPAVAQRNPPGKAVRKPPAMVERKRDGAGGRR
ncbi:MAG: IclR family transcriptional regulator [Burkholderiales bacterium]|nr:IclR family transcriptional regulator [Burkholderiales bacterium]